MNESGMGQLVIKFPDRWMMMMAANNWIVVLPYAFKFKY
jgi:hypothetical protein